MEVMLKGNTIIVESEKDINKSLLDCEDVNTPAFITLSQLIYNTFPIHTEVL